MDDETEYPPVIGSPIEFFDQIARPNFEEFWNSARDERRAMNAVLSFAHLLDWTAPGKGKDRIERQKLALVAKHEERVRDLGLHFEVVLDLSNGLKHMHRTSNKIGADALQQGRFTCGMPVGTSLRPLVVDFYGDHILVDSVLFTMCSLWHLEIDEMRSAQRS